MTTLTLICDKCGEKKTVDLNNYLSENCLNGWFLSSIEDVCPTCVGTYAQRGRFYKTIPSPKIADLVKVLHSTTITRV